MTLIAFQAVAEFSTFTVSNQRPNSLYNEKGGAYFIPFSRLLSLSHPHPHPRSLFFFIRWVPLIDVLTDESPKSSHTHTPLNFSSTSSCSHNRSHIKSSFLFLVYHP